MDTVNRSENIDNTNPEVERIKSESRTASVNRAKQLYYGKVRIGPEEMYDRWKETYEQDMIGLCYVGPSTIAAKVRYFYPEKKDVYILDVGCGTGWVAEECKKLGYTNIDGVDASSELLKEAKSRNLYKKTIHSYVGGDTPLPIADNTYDILVGSGVIQNEHLPPNCVFDLCRIMKPGGLIMMLCNNVCWNKYERLHVDMKNNIDQLVKDKQWRPVEWSILEDYARYEENTPGLFFVFKKL